MAGTNRHTRSAQRASTRRQSPTTAATSTATSTAISTAIAHTTAEDYFNSFPREKTPQEKPIDEFTRRLNAIPPRTHSRCRCGVTYPHVHESNPPQQQPSVWIWQDSPWWLFFRMLLPTIGSMLGLPLMSLLLGGNWEARTNSEGRRVLVMQIGKRPTGLMPGESGPVDMRGFDMGMSDSQPPSFSEHPLFLLVIFLGICIVFVILAMIFTVIHDLIRGAPRRRLRHSSPS